jgi:hypothetical protein
MTDILPPTLPTADELNDLRKRVLAGEEFPAEEYRKIIQAYRANRMGAVAAAAPKAKAKAASSAKATPQDLATLMGSLGL